MCLQLSLKRYSRSVIKPWSCRVALVCHETIPITTPVRVMSQNEYTVTKYQRVLRCTITFGPSSFWDHIDTDWNILSLQCEPTDVLSSLISEFRQTCARIPGWSWWRWRAGEREKGSRGSSSSSRGTPALMEERQQSSFVLDPRLRTAPRSLRLPETLPEHWREQTCN